MPNYKMENQYEYEKYVCSKETLKQMITEYGIAIIPNVLDENECVNMVNGISDFLEYITQEFDIPLNRHDTGSWREFYKLYPLHSMLLQHFGVGHAQVSWDIRQNIKIEDFIHKIYIECARELWNNPYLFYPIFRVCKFLLRLSPNRMELAF